MSKPQTALDTVRFVTTIPASLRRDLKVEAAKRGTTMTELVEAALRAFLERK